ncbi:uncharacterized protein LOC109826085 [Asparagus officinalis]|nr:uncharacterized protein LOC109826085 [Asparagus officinalis]
MPLTNDPPTFEVASLDLIPSEEESVESNQLSYVDSNREQQSLHQMPADNHVLNPSTMPLLEPQLNWEPPQLQLENLPNPELDFPLLLEGSDRLIQQFEDTGFEDNSSFLQITENMPFLGLGDGTSSVKIDEGHSAGAPDSFFDDFPVDMFDFMEQPQPLPTPPGACGSLLCQR